MIKYVCDKCGKDITNGKNVTLIINTANISSVAEYMKDFETELDLCGECVKEIIGKQIDEIAKEIDERNAVPYNLEPGDDFARLNLSVRSHNILKRAGYNTIEDLLKLAPSELRNVRNMGAKSLDEIQKKLAMAKEQFKDER